MEECFYGRVLVDPELAHFFEGIDMDVLREHLADFMMALTGGPDIYKGRNLRKAHQGFRITEVDFNRLITHLAAAAEELQIEPQDIATVAAAIIDLKDQVVTA